MGSSSGKLSHIPLFPTPAIEGQVCSELLSSKAPSVVAADLQQQMRPNTPIPNSVKREPESEMSGMFSHDDTPNKYTNHCAPTFCAPSEDKIKIKIRLPC